jgi:hypothetical protein
MDTPIQLTDLPKPLRKKAKQVLKLWSAGKLHDLRALRDSTQNLQIQIYHHSQGTDSYFHDIEGRYYTWSEVESSPRAKTEAGEHLMCVVMEYKPGRTFIRGSLTPSPILN